MNRHRLRLLDGMTSAVARKGYSAVTIADVVAEAGVSKRTFYEHFDGKEACLLACYVEGSSAMLAAIRQQLAAGAAARTPTRSDSSEDSGGPDGSGNSEIPEDAEISKNSADSGGGPDGAGCAAGPDAEVGPDGEPGPSLMQAVLETYLGWLDRAPQMAATLLIEVQRSGAAGRRVYRQTNLEFAVLIRDSVAAGRLEVAGFDLDQAVALVGGVNELVLTHAEDNPEIPFSTLIPAVLRFVRAVILG